MSKTKDLRYNYSKTESEIVNFLPCRNVHDSIQKNNETQVAGFCCVYHQIRELWRLEKTCTQQRALCIVLYNRITLLFFVYKIRNCCVSCHIRLLCSLKLICSNVQERTLRHIQAQYDVTIRWLWQSYCLAPSLHRIRILPVPI